MKLSIQGQRVEINSIKRVQKPKEDAIALTLVNGDIMHIPFWTEKNPRKACNKAVIALMQWFKNDKDVVFELN